MMKVIHCCRSIDDAIALSRTFQSNHVIVCQAVYHGLLSPKVSSKARVLVLEDLSDQALEQTAQQFNQLIAQVGRDDLSWWAHPLSEKNEHGFGAELYRRLCSALMFIETIEAQENDTHFILCIEHDDIALIIKENSVELDFSVVMHREMKTVLFDVVRYVKGIVQMKLFVSMFLLRYMKVKRLGKIKKWLKQDLHNVYVLRTWLDGRFLSQSSYEDSYFGILPRYLKEQGYQVITLAGILNHDDDILQKIDQHCEDIIIPEEYFARFTDILRASIDWFKCQFNQIQIRKSRWMGLSVAGVLQKAFRSPQLGRQFLFNRTRFCMYSRMTRLLKPVQLSYTFENYAWEKMIIKAVKTVSPEVWVTGFQHAFISPNSFKYFSTPHELLSMPKPDRIVCLGSITRTFLLSKSGWDVERLMVGCALRQSQSQASSSWNADRKEVLVPLTMVDAETRQTIEFLNAVDWKSLQMQVTLRPHPATIIADVLKRTGVRLHPGITISVNRQLESDLERAGVLLYTWSTVALQALDAGIPVVYLDILRPLYVNPVLKKSQLAMGVQSPEQLIEIMTTVKNFTPQYHQRLSAEVKEYLKEYFYPVNPIHLNIFIKP